MDNRRVPVGKTKRRAAHDRVMLDSDPASDALANCLRRYGNFGSRHGMAVGSVVPGCHFCPTSRGGFPGCLMIGDDLLRSAPGRGRQAGALWVGITARCGRCWVRRG